MVCLLRPIPFSTFRSLTTMHSNSPAGVFIVSFFSTCLWETVIFIVRPRALTEAYTSGSVSPGAIYEGRVDSPPVDVILVFFGKMVLKRAATDSATSRVVAFFVMAAESSAGSSP